MYVALMVGTLVVSAAPNATGDIGNWTEPIGLASLFVEGSSRRASTGTALPPHARTCAPPPADPLSQLELAWMFVLTLVALGMASLGVLLWAAVQDGHLLSEPPGPEVGRRVSAGRDRRHASPRPATAARGPAR